MTSIQFLSIAACSFIGSSVDPQVDQLTVVREAMAASVDNLNSGEGEGVHSVFERASSQDGWKLTEQGEAVVRISEGKYSVALTYEPDLGRYDHEEFLFDGTPSSPLK